MIQPTTLDEAIVEAHRFIKAAKALRAARKRKTLGDSFSAPACNGEVTPEDIKKAMEAPYRPPLAPAQHAATLRASMDLTRKLADLRQSR